MTITADGIARLRRVQTYMRAHPERVDMEFWLKSDHPSYVEEGGVFFVPTAPLVPNTPILGLLEDCGTVCCIAGMLVALEGEAVTPGTRIDLHGSHLIDGPDDYALPDLFDASDWPPELGESYFNAETPEERVAVVCTAIDRWIEGRGSFTSRSAVE